MQAFTSDFDYHHITDPRSGHSSPELASVSVSAPRVALADGLATSVMVMEHNGVKMIEQLSDREVYAVTKELKIIQTNR
jgi:thiamine biosynthesis lipoprotein ApbE